MSQADKGEVDTPSPRLYIGNDASPWALGLYAHVLAKTPGGELDVLPSGRLRLEKLRAVTVGEGPQKAQLEAYLLSGVDLTPEILLLDKQGRLFAHLSGSILVREGYEKQYEALKVLGESLTLELLQAMQKKVAHAYEAPVRIRNVHLFDPQTQTTGAAGVARRVPRADHDGGARDRRAGACGRSVDRRPGRNAGGRSARHALA